MVKHFSMSFHSEFPLFYKKLRSKIFLVGNLICVSGVINFYFETFVCIFSPLNLQINNIA